MSQLLHPSALDDFGLPATLTAYLRNFSHRTASVRSSPRRWTRAWAGY
jgi:signal transduction histidine kinase